METIKFFSVVFIYKVHRRREGLELSFLNPGGSLLSWGKWIRANNRLPTTCPPSKGQDIVYSHLIIYTLMLFLRKGIRSLLTELVNGRGKILTQVCLYPKSIQQSTAPTGTGEPKSRWQMEPQGFPTRFQNKIKITCGSTVQNFLQRWKCSIFASLNIVANSHMWLLSINAMINFKFYFILISSHMW